MEHLLLRLFPNDVLGPETTSPLSAANFRTFILLPEVALRLIMEDLTEDRAGAMANMQWSIWYGLRRYPLRQEHEVEYDMMLAELYREVHPIQPVDSDGNEAAVGNEIISLGDGGTPSEDIELSSGS